MMREQDEEVQPLSESEIQQLRGLLKSEDRAVWFWATLKVWSTWLAAVILGVTLGWDALKKLVQALK
jgi:hypothetical protein